MSSPSSPAMASIACFSVCTHTRHTSLPSITSAGDSCKWRCGGQMPPGPVHNSSSGGGGSSTQGPRQRKLPVHNILARCSPFRERNGYCYSGVDTIEAGRRRQQSLALSPAYSCQAAGLLIIFQLRAQFSHRGHSPHTRTREREGKKGPGTMHDSRRQCNSPRVDWPNL